MNDPMPSEPAAANPRGLDGSLDPIDVCTLDATALAERIDWVRRTLAPHVVGRYRLPKGVALELREADGLEAHVDHWIELERQCCGGIGWDRGKPSQPARYRVEITGVDPDGLLFEGFPLLGDSTSTTSSEVSAGCADGCGPGDARAGRGRRWLKAAGAGTFASLLVCCILPMGLTLLLGAGAGALTLSWLDHPVWIGLGAIVGAILADRWASRQREALG